MEEPCRAARVIVQRLPQSGGEFDPISGQHICILAHGFIDTFGVVAAFFGWFS